MKLVGCRANKEKKNFRNRVNRILDGEEPSEITRLTDTATTFSITDPTALPSPTFAKFHHTYLTFLLIKSSSSRKRRTITVSLHSTFHLFQELKRTNTRFHYTGLAYKPTPRGC